MDFHDDTVTYEVTLSITLSERNIPALTGRIGQMASAFATTPGDWAIVGKTPGDDTPVVLVPFAAQTAEQAEQYKTWTDEQVQR